MIETFIKLLKQEGYNFKNQIVIFDIGSRDCQQSIEFFNHFPNAKIFAFECNQNTLQICRKNIINYDRIMLIDRAVNIHDGECTFYPINQKKTVTTWKDGNPGASSLFKSNGSYTVEHYVQDETIVKCNRLDTLMKEFQIEKVDLIWMDLQGAELLALKSLGIYLKDVKYVHTEVSYKEMYTGQVMYEELNEFMLQNGFMIVGNSNRTEWQQDIIYKNKQQNSVSVQIPEQKKYLIPKNQPLVDLTQFKYNKYSQRGHDGIIEKICHELNIKKGFFIEFGGWDGIHLSNCRNLYEKGWEGCFIEADKFKYSQLLNNYKNTQIYCIHTYVYPTTYEGIVNKGQTIDEVCSNELNNREIDLISIDIDGRDYEIFETMTIKPKIIIIEGGFLFHPCLRAKIPYSEAQNNVQQPLFIMFQLAKSKGYTPICFNQDSFLLRNDLYEKYRFFHNIKNDHYNLWVNAYYNIFNDNDRKWLNGYRKSHQIVKKYENIYLHDIKLNDVFDIVIPLGPNDINQITRQIENTKNNVIGYRNIYLVSYDDKIQIDGCITIDEKIFPFTTDDVAKYHGKRTRNGWYLQQLIKLYAGFYIPSILDKYLVIDSDTHFLKPTTFLNNGKCLYANGTEYHEEYFIHMNKLHSSLNKNDPNKSGICHHMMFEKRFLKSMFEMVESINNDVFWKIFLDKVTNYGGAGASEYEIYFNYLLKYYPNEIELRQLNWLNTNLNLLDTIKKQNKYDYCACHWHY